MLDHASHQPALARAASEHVRPTPLYFPCTRTTRNHAVGGLAFGRSQQAPRMEAPPRHLGHKAGICLTYPSKGAPTACSNPSCATRKSTRNLRVFQLVIIAALGALNPARPFYMLAVRGGVLFVGRVGLRLASSCVCSHVAAPGAPSAAMQAEKTRRLFVDFLVVQDGLLHAAGVPRANRVFLDGL